MPRTRKEGETLVTNNQNGRIQVNESILLLSEGSDLAPEMPDDDRITGVTSVGRTVLFTNEHKIYKLAQLRKNTL